MERHRQRPSGRWLGNQTRRGASLYLLGFFLAVASTPHRHFNSLEDLLSDGPSDSGIFVVSPVVASDSSPCVSSSRLIDDDSCLACFLNDYVASAGAPFVLPAGSSSLQLAPSTADPATPEPLSESPASRSPPNLLRFS